MGKPRCHLLCLPTPQHIPEIYFSVTLTSADSLHPTAVALVKDTTISGPHNSFQKGVLESTPVPLHFFLSVPPCFYLFLTPSFFLLSFVFFSLPFLSPFLSFLSSFLPSLSFYFPPSLSLSFFIYLVQALRIGNCVSLWVL